MPSPDRRSRLSAALLVAGVAFAVRLVYLLQFHHSVFFASPILDAAWHDQWARRIAAGHLLDGAPYFRAPFYPWFLALVYALGGGGPWAPRLLQSLLGALAAGGLTWAAWPIAGRRAARVAGFILAFYGPLVFLGGELLLEALLIPLLVGALILFLRGQEQLGDADAGVAPWFWGGVALGIAGITRPNALLLVPAALASPWVLVGPGPARTRARRILLPIVAGAVLPILPVTGINFVASGDLVWIASQGGINFYAGNNPRADGRHLVVPELDTASGWEDFVPRVRSAAEEAVGHRLRPSQVSDYWTGRGLEWIRENPGQALTLYGRKLHALLSGYEIPNNRDIYVARRDSWLLAALVGRIGPLFLPWGLLLPLAAVGLLAHRDRRRLYFFWSFAALLGLSALPFFIFDRLRVLPAVCLAVPAALGLLALPDLVRARSRGLPALAAGLVVLLAANFDPGADTRGNPADAWHKLGEALYNRGDSRGALEAFDRALALDPRDPLPRLGRAFALQSLGRDSLAGRDFADAAARLPESWQAQYGYGRFLQLENRPAEAISFLEKAAGLMPERAELHRDLGFAYEAAGREREAGLALSHALRLGEETAEIHLSLGLAALRAGNTELAENNWKRAIELDPGQFRSLYNLGLLRFEQGRLEEAGKYWTQAALADTTSFLAPFQLARLAIRQGDRPAAARHLRRALDLGLPPAKARQDPLLGEIAGP